MTRRHADQIRADIAATLDIGVERRLVSANKAAIPRILHQTYFSKTLPRELQENVDALRARNSGWSYHLYDDTDIERFIADEYGEPVLARYHRIAPAYGAARADLFRYLAVYRCGGVYLDIKSTADVPLDTILVPGDRFIVSQWENGPGKERAVWGLHPDLRHIPGGEFQQWFIAAAPGHPFLRAVIERVLFNIDTYNPYRVGVGLNVVRVTGPIPYTLAIAPLLNYHSHRRVAHDRELGLRYSVMAYHAHHTHFRGHYSQRRTPIVGDRGGTVGHMALVGFLAVRSYGRRVIKQARRVYARLLGRSIEIGL